MASTMDLPATRALRWGELCQAAITENHDLYLWKPVDTAEGFDSNKDARKVPVPVPKPLPDFRGRVQDISIGWDHMCMATMDGELFSCGVGTFGQLGHGDKRDREVPTKIQAFEPQPIQQLACGWSYSLCLTRSGAVYGWGAAASGQLGLGDRVRQTTPRHIAALDGLSICSIACGESHTVAVDRDGGVFSWGSAEDACLGRDAMQSNDLPGRVTEFDRHSASWGHAAAIVCGTAFTSVLTDLGKIVCWGRTQPIPTLLALDGFSGCTFVAIGGDSGRTTALTDLGDLLTVSNESGDEILFSSRVAVQGDLSQVSDMACLGENFNLVLHGGVVHVVPLENTQRAEEPQPTAPVLPESVKAAAVQLRRALRGLTAHWRCKSLCRAFWTLRVTESHAAIGGAGTMQKSRHRTMFLKRIARHWQRGKTSRAFLHWRRKHELENQESNKRVADELVHQLSSRHDQALRQVAIARDRSSRMGMRLGCNLVHGALRELSHWSKKKGFDKWKLIAAAAEKESELRRARMKLQVHMNHINSEKLALQELREFLRRSRTHLASIVFFYRWKSRIDRSVRLAAEAKVIHQRQHLTDTLRELRDLMSQASQVEASVTQTTLQRGTRISARVDSALTQLKDSFGAELNATQETGASRALYAEAKSDPTREGEVANLKPKE